MTDFLNSLKTDLFDRRLRVVAGVLLAGLLAAIIYAALGGGGGSSGSAPEIPVASEPGAAGIAVSPASTNPNEAVAEVTSGASAQHGGLSHDPFGQLPGAAATTTTTTTTTTTSTSAAAKSGSSSAQAAGSGSTPAGSGGGGGSSSAAPAPKQTQHAPAPKPVYKVSVQLGQVPAGTAPQSAQLTPYENLHAQEKLPSSQQQLLSFAGVTQGGKRASFKLLAEAIPRGPAACLPSVTQCEAIALKPGESEELEYLQAGTAPVLYVLHVVSIDAQTNKASGAKAARLRVRLTRPLLDATGQSHSPEAVLLVH